MTAGQLLAALQARQARVTVRDGRLHVEAPQGALDASLKAALRAQRDAVVALLTTDPGALLTTTFERIAAFWIEGAELPPTELEHDIDRAVLAGDLAALSAALSIYEQAARHACAQRQHKIYRGDHASNRLA